MTVTPLGTPAGWSAVMEQAEHQCQCRGGCGAKHASKGQLFRCERTTRHDRLIAAPADLLLTTTAAAAVPVEQLLAWCLICHRGALARQRADARERARQEQDEQPPALLFDI